MREEIRHPDGRFVVKNFGENQEAEDPHRLDIIRAGANQRPIKEEPLEDGPNSHFGTFWRHRRDHVETILKS